MEQESFKEHLIGNVFIRFRVAVAPREGWNLVLVFLGICTVYTKKFGIFSFLGIGIGILHTKNTKKRQYR